MANERGPSDFKRIYGQLMERMCKTCQGEGRVIISQGHIETMLCEACKGTGLTTNSVGRRPRPMENKFR